VLRPAPTETPDVIAIGSSTGGPQALFAVLSSLKAGSLRQPILITQHMPPTFTTILAEHITRVSGWQAAEGQDGEVVTANRIYIAPGDFHMVVESRGSDKIIRLNKNPPENFCRPSVDPMLRSLAAAYGRRVLVVILTGMGSDGLRGGQVVIGAGGSVIAQDEATSVVWGMPGAVATAGICSAVLPLPEIAPQIMRLATRH
jgi:two-component system chemotaxis response regulator CheB